MNNIKSYLAVGVLCSGLTIGAYKILGFDKKEVIFTESAAPTAYTKYTAEGPAARPGVGALPVDFTVAAERTTPAVVHIKSTVVSTRNQEMGELPDFFRDFFGDMPQQRQGGPQKSQSSGSGVIFSPDGYIVTNNHVVDKADEVEVVLFDKRTIKAKVIGTDPSTDLAVIKVDLKELPYLAVGNSDQVKVGEWVLAVGNPFNLESTVTAGIVSAKSRSINILRLEDGTGIESFIQTDAAVNPGNSGGALVNLQGELIGINTAIATPTGTYAGYAFAVPSGIVKKVAEDIIKYGVVQRGYLGVRIQNVDGKLAEELKLKTFAGVYVADLSENSSAAKAGIKKGDVITKVGDQRTNTSAELQEIVARHRPGDVVNVTVFRDGKDRDFKVELLNREGNSSIVKRDEATAAPVSLGVKLEDLTDKEKKELELSGGAKVSKLLAGKMEDTGIREGFIITNINDKPVKNAKEAMELLQNKKGTVTLGGVYPGFSSREFIYAFKN